MNHLDSDITLSQEWLDEQENRLLGFEVLRAFVLSGRGVWQMDPAVIAEKTLSDKGLPHRIIQRIASDPSLTEKLKYHDGEL